MVRAASTGLGRWSEEPARSMQDRSDLIRIVSCNSPSPKKRAEFAAEFATGEHDPFGAAPAGPSIDAIKLTTPHSLHAEHVSRAAMARQHVLVEKPFARPAESGRGAAATCETANAVLAVGHNRRFSTSGNRLRKLCDSGAFGTLLNLEAKVSAPGSLACMPGGAVCNVAVMEVIAESAAKGTTVEIDAETRSAWMESQQ